MDTPIGFGAGRRKTLQAINKKDRLAPIEDPDTIEVLIGSVHEISLASVRSPPRDTVDRLIEVYNELPEQAKSEYLGDGLLIQRINTARKQFNDWLGKRRRMAEMASPMEAGRSNYPVKKARRLSRLEQEANDDLEGKIRRIKSAAGGGRQRALDAIGSSVSEYNEKRRERRRKELRERLEEGSIVKFRNPKLQVGRVVRVNRHSVRVQYPNPRAGATCPISGETEPESAEDRVQLHSEYLELLDAETVEEGEEAIGRQRENR